MRVPTPVALPRESEEPRHRGADATARNRRRISPVMTLALASTCCVLAATLCSRPLAAGAPAGQSPRYRLKTDGGLEIALDEQGQVSSLRAAGRRLDPARPDAGGGLYVAVRPDSGLHRVAGRLLKEDGGWRQQASLNPLGLEVDALWVASPAGLEVRGTIRDVTGRSRAVDVVLRLPVELRGAQWCTDLTTCQPLAARSLATDFPLAAVDSSGGLGLAMAIPPDRPCRYELSADPAAGWLQARWELGLSPRTREPGTAQFAIVLYRVDPDWGLRDALRRYYAAFPDTFHKVATKEGGWLFAFPAEKLPNPQDYAYHEGRAGAWEIDERLGLATCPYRIPVQRQIILPRLPADDEAAAAEIGRLAAGPSGEAKATTARMMLSCATWDADGWPHIVRRDNVGADIRPEKPIFNVVYAVNADPDLFCDCDEITVGRFELDAIDTILRKYPEVDGIYLDSITGWGSRYPNFREEHFPYVDGPLTYDDKTFRVCVPGWQHTYEFVRELHRRLASQGRVVFPNLNRASRRDHFLYFTSDVIGLEGGLRQGEFEPALNYFRSLAGQKPVLVMDYLRINGRPTRIASREGFERFWKWCVLYGVYPSVGRECDRAWEQFRDVYDRYREPLRRIATAGWEPVTFARANAPGVRLERFGEVRRGLFFTLLNPTGKPRETRLEVNAAALELPATLEATDLVTGQSRQSPLRFTLAAGQLQVLRLRPVAAPDR